jgi:hypothetical protein
MLNDEVEEIYIYIYIYVLIGFFKCTKVDGCQLRLQMKVERCQLKWLVIIMTSDCEKR